jgi:hypothetical protein
MRLDEEAQHLEAKTLKHARLIGNSTALKQVLFNALISFEQVLNGLPPQEREDALALYLDKVRRLAFGFDLALVRQSTRDRFVKTQNLNERQQILSKHAEDMQRIGTLYRFL